jgi:hypothetical protein
MHWCAAPSAICGIAVRPPHFVRVDSRDIASGPDGMRKILADGRPRPIADLYQRRHRYRRHD